jgi:Phage derived protein Gp49-like (DUF891)
MDSEEDLMFLGDWLAVRAMRRTNGRMPAREWADGLDKRGQGQLLAAAAILETTLRSGRPPGGRAESVKASRMGLWELKVTKPGGTPPHLRVLYVRRDRTLWAANGFTKQTNELSIQDIRGAERILKEWSDEN